MWTHKMYLTLSIQLRAIKLQQAMQFIDINGFLENDGLHLTSTN